MDNTNTQTDDLNLQQAQQLAQDLKQANDQYDKDVSLVLADLEKESDELEKEFGALEIGLQSAEKKGTGQMDAAITQFMLEEDQLAATDAQEDAAEPPDEN